MPALAAQGPAAREWQLGAQAVWARRAFYGAGPGWAVRVPGQMRFAFEGAGGVLDGAAAGRVGVQGQFLVTPTSRQGVSVYAGLGVAEQVAAGRRGAAYLSLALGVESPEGRRGGWFLEAGLAGGFRVAVGRRWRRLPAWWP